MTRQVTFKGDILKFGYLNRDVAWLYCCCIHWLKCLICITMIYYDVSWFWYHINFALSHIFSSIYFCISLWHGFVHVFINTQNNSLPFPWSPTTAAEMINTFVAHPSLSPGNDKCHFTSLSVLSCIDSWNNDGF